jgi:hypothetical protein
LFPDVPFRFSGPTVVELFDDDESSLDIFEGDAVLDPEERVVDEESMLNDEEGVVVGSEVELEDVSLELVEEFDRERLAAVVGPVGVFVVSLEDCVELLESEVPFKVKSFA